MPTLAEVLKQSGLSQEQIDALDAKVMNSLGGVLNTADLAQKAAQDAAAKADADRKAAEAAVAAAKTAQEATELQKRSVDEFWQNTYTVSYTHLNDGRGAESLSGSLQSHEFCSFSPL